MRPQSTPKLCSMPGCEKPAHARGLCGMHLQRERTYGDPAHPPGKSKTTFKPGQPAWNKGIPISEETREKQRKAKLGKTRGPAKPCSVAGCDRPSRSGEMCTWHYQRAKLYGDPNHPKQPGPTRFKPGQSPPNKGKPLSPETKEKLRVANLGRKASAETRAKMSVALKGLVRSPENCEKLRVANTGKHCSEATRLKISKANKGKPGIPVSEERRLAFIERTRKRAGIPTGRPPGHSKREWYQGHAFRSSWEVRFAKALDGRGIAWQYEPKRFYFDDCSYLPDFFVPATGTYYEVKGWMSPESQRRIDAFRKYQPNIPLIVISRKELFQTEDGSFPI